VRIRLHCRELRPHPLSLPRRLALLAVLYAVCALGCEIGCVRLCELIRRELLKIVNVHVQWPTKTRLPVPYGVSRYYSPHRDTTRDVDFGRVGERLINNAIPFCQTDEGIKLLFAGVSVQIEL
jgi:hypothetical protein